MGPRAILTSLPELAREVREDWEAERKSRKRKINPARRAYEEKRKVLFQKAMLEFQKNVPESIKRRVEHFLFVSGLQRDRYWDFIADMFKVQRIYTIFDKDNSEEILRKYERMYSSRGERLMPRAYFNQLIHEIAIDRLTHGVVRARKMKFKRLYK